MSDDNLSPDLEETLDEHVRWVHQATELALREGGTGVTKAIDALEDGQLRGMIFVLVSSRAHDLERLREVARDQIAREQLEGLDGRGSVTLN